MSHSGWAEWRRFSAAMLALVGAFNVVEGLVVAYDSTAAVERDRLLLLGPAGWGLVGVALGVLLLALAVWLALVTVRVRLTAVPAVVVHALTQLGVLTAKPAWALLMIMFDVIIIFALTVTPAGAARGAGALSARRRTRATGAAAAGGLAAAGGPSPVDSGAAYAVDDLAPRSYRPRHRLTLTTATVAGPLFVAAASDIVRHRATVGPESRRPARRAPASRPAAAAGAEPIIGAISGRHPDRPLGGGQA